MSIGCAVCGHRKDDHPFRHPFQGPDQDVVLDPPKPATKTSTQAIPVTGPEGMMIMLLRVLSQKGVLDGDDLARILTGDANAEDNAGSRTEASG